MNGPDLWAALPFDMLRANGWFGKGCSKMPGCKACEVMRNEAYCCVRRKDE